MNAADSLNRPSYLMPLVLHRIVKNKVDSWEDINEKIFVKMVDVVGSSWVTVDKKNVDQLNGWCLTFDDGNLSDYEIAYPILSERGVGAIFFLIVEKIGKKGYLTWSQIEEMSRNGMTFGSHSMTHKSMISLSKKDVLKEFCQSKGILEDKTGDPITSFSFPFGDNSRELNQVCFEAGYTLAFTSRHGFASKNSSVIPRNSINSNMNWPDIISVLEPKLGMRLQWVFEDRVKSLVKNVVGRDRYTQLRDRILHD